MVIPSTTRTRWGRTPWVTQGHIDVCERGAFTPNMFNEAGVRDWAHANLPGRHLTTDRDGHDVVSATVAGPWGGPSPIAFSPMDEYAIRGGQAGYERLQLLAAERHGDTAALLDRAHLTPGMACVDLGCGGGAVTFELAARVGPTGSVTGIDLDEVKVGLAGAAARERGLDNVRFAVADLTAWSAPDSYDVVYARFVLQHVRDPISLLARMWSAVRVGGRLIVEDADFEGCFSEPDKLRARVVSTDIPGPATAARR